MSSDIPSPFTTEYSDEQESGQKRLRSTREYREQKKLKKALTSHSTSSSSQEPDQPYVASPRDDFVRLVKDTVAKLCHERLGYRTRQDSDEVPEWRAVSRRVSSTLIEKEARMPEDVRFNVSDQRLRENAVKRVTGYTVEYLDRKYPRSKE